jgi:hypothetical protein
MKVKRPLANPARKRRLAARKRRLANPIVGRQLANPIVKRQLANPIYQNSFGAFCYRAFEILYPGQKLIANWHIDHVCYEIEQTVVVAGSKQKLVLNQPPRTLKTHIVSICLPAWILGAIRAPGSSAQVTVKIWRANSRATAAL